LGFAILGQASTGQAALGALSAVFAMVYATFVVASPSSHFNSSFLCLWRFRMEEREYKLVLFDW
jgi:hypothetical protein